MSNSIYFNYSQKASGEEYTCQIGLLNQQPYSDYSVQKLLNIFSNDEFLTNQINKSNIFPRFKITILNEDCTTNREIDNEFILSGSYNENYQNGQRRTLSFELINNNGEFTPSIDNLWIGTKLKLEIGIEIAEYNAILYFSKGVFCITSINPQITSENRTVSIESSDKFSILESPLCALIDPYEIPVGSIIEDVIWDILNQPKGDGSCIDSLPFIYNSFFKGKTVQQTITASTGDTWGSVILQLAEMLSAEVFYNSNGQLTFVPIADTTWDSDKASIFDFDSNKGNVQNINIPFDYNQIVNRIVVVGSVVNGHTCKAIAINDDDKSPISSNRIGIRTGQIVNDQNITSDLLAQERADYELRKQIIAKTQLSSTVFFNPLLSVNNIVTYTDDFFEFEKERFVIQSVSFSLGYEGTCSLTVSNLNNLPFTN